MSPWQRVYVLVAVLVLCCVSLGAADPPLPSNNGPIANTNCGRLQGTWQNVSARPSVTHPAPASTVAAFLGIPYAAPPVDERRWTPPAPVHCWPASHVYDATQYADVCFQNSFGFGPYFGKEDCLYLNVYVPQQQWNKTATALANNAPLAASSLLPVLFYIHGGNLVYGSGAWEPVQPFAAHVGTEGAVVVTINYRLGVFGFLAFDALARTAPSGQPVANFGILDQLQALQWTKQNIAIFGGDPNRVTLGGQSSGGTSIFALLSSPLSAGLFSGAIAMSGSINVSMTLDVGLQQNQVTVQAVGCAKFPQATRVVDCMRKKEASVIAQNMPYSWNTPGFWGIADLLPSGRQYGGLPLIDGVVITQSFENAFAQGLVDVPVIFGNMAQEAELIPDDYQPNFLNQTSWLAYLNLALAAFPNPTTAANDIYNLYQVDSAVNPQKAYDSFNADYSLTCGSNQIAQGVISAHHRASKVYLHFNTFAPLHPIPSLNINDVTYNLTYAFHSFDWGAATENWALINPLLSGPPPGWQPSEQEYELSYILQDAWYQLMSNGNVNGWQTIDATNGGVTTMILAPSSQGGVHAQLNNKHDVCQQLASLGFSATFWWCD